MSSTARPERRAATLALAFCLGCAGMLSQAVAQPPGPPRASPAATLSQVVGVSRLEITYSRPQARGREIWGKLVPWGEVWRTGANEATTFRVTDDVRIDGEPLAAGEYALFTIPSPDQWTLVFNRAAEQWGAFDYDPEKDALRVRVRPRAAEFQEAFEIRVPAVGNDAVTVQLHWGEVMVPFEVVFDLQSAAIRRAREFVAHATPADGRAVWNWANYFLQSGFHTAEALEWAHDLAAGAPMYWTHALEARLLAANGRPAEAVAAADQALARAPQDSEQQGVEADAQRLAEEAKSWREQAAGAGG